MKTKKILSVLLVALMALAFSGLTAFAAASITVTSQKPDGSTDNTEYTYYQILKANISTDGGKVAYFVENADQAAELTATGVFTVTKVVAGDYWTVESTETDGAAIAEKLAAMDLTKFTVTGKMKAGEKKDVDPGYYLVLSSLGTKLAVATTKDVTIKADIIEEITRIYGYDNFKITTTLSPLRPVRRSVIKSDEYYASPFLLRLLLRTQARQLLLPIRQPLPLTSSLTQPPLSTPLTTLLFSSMLISPARKQPLPSAPMLSR